MSFASRVREHWPGQAAAILDLIQGRTSPEAYASVQRWIQQCYHRPPQHELIACALNEVLGTYGVEAIFRDSADRWPVLEYLNTGDTYAATLCYRYGAQRWRVSTMGDEVERLGL